MPFPWIGWIAEPVQNQLPTQVVVDQQLRVWSLHRAGDGTKQVSTFDGQVEADYGKEKIFADHLEVHAAPDERWALARGNVRIVDPDGFITADEVRFSYAPETTFADAENVVVKIAGATIRAASIDIRPNLWTLRDFFGTTDRAKTPLYAVTGKVMVIVPGQDARISRPSYYFLGKKVLTLKSATFSLDPRSEGFRYPTVQYRRGDGLGIDWSAGLLLNDTTGLTYHTDFFKNTRPGIGLQLTRSWIPADKSDHLIAPRSELDQRFAFGYFDNIEVVGPNQEAAYMAQTRRSISVSTSLNQGVVDRGALNETFTEPVQFTYETGGAWHSFSDVTDVRLESIQRESDPLMNRAIAQTSIEAPRVSFAPNLYSLVRSDASYFQSSNSFGWARLTSGLVFQASKELRLSGALVGGFDGGRPDFDIDPLYWTNGYVLRADAHVGPRTISVMERFDVHRHFFDQELSFTQALGSLEFYALYRRYPDDYRYGVRLRMDQFVDLLRRRRSQRFTGSPDSN